MLHRLMEESENLRWQYDVCREMLWYKERKKERMREVRGQIVHQQWEVHFVCIA